MRRYLLAAAAILFSAFGLDSASALVEGKKVALVIGNSAYVHAVTLPNPINDGKLMAETFRKAGFSVIEGEDLNKVDMGRLLDQFTEAAYDADIAIVYYAGHGLQVDQRNYLIPVDAELQNTAQLQTRTIPVDDVLNALPPDPAVGIVILDACRDNPLARTLAAALPKSRSMGAGLAVVQAAGRNHDSGGLLVAYATDPEAVAYDGKGANSPYTTALARHITTPGLEIQSALTRVRADVSEATNGAQHPWANASLGREVFLGAPPPDTQSSPPQAAARAAEPVVNGAEIDWTVEQKVWDEASKRNTVAHYELYLSQYPNGRFANVARLNIEQLKQAGASQTASAGPANAAAAAESSQAEASQIRTGVAIPDDVKQTPGTPETEAQIKLDKEGRIDLQLRLSALGHNTGGFDGSLGHRTRTAIGEWQRDGGIAETTYLTPQQHMLLVVQTDPLMAAVRAQYESQKAAAVSRRQAAKAPSAGKATQKTATTARRKSPQQTAEDDIPYRPRGTGAPVENGGSEAGTFAAGALLGTALGVAIGKH